MSIARSKGYEVFEEKPFLPYNLNIVGIRNFRGRVNYFDDFINIYYQRAGEWVAECFPATTLPGTRYLFRPKVEKGTAILKAGQYLAAYRKGLHQGKYEALVQVGAVTVYRDNNKDAIPDKDMEEETGFFGINIHRASFGAKLVGPNSAGCQVIKEADDYKKFMYYIDKALGYRDNVFTYTLIEI